jgi:hypothetical protein
MHFTSGCRPQDEGEAHIDRACGEGRDDGLDAPIDDHAAIDETAGRTCRDTGCDAPGDLARTAVDEMTRDAAHERHDGADGKIEARHENGHSLGHGDERQGESLVGVLDQYLPGEAAGMVRLIEKIEQDEERQCSENARLLLQPQADASPSEARPLPGLHVERG